MYTTLHCISLRSVRHSDKASILSVWTAENGRMSLSMPEGAGREARRRRALTMPLAMFECEADIRAQARRDIYSVRDLKGHSGSMSLHSRPAKSCMAVFVADVLDLLLRESQPDEALWDFLSESVGVLAMCDSGRALQNFPMVFLYRLMHFMGIGPDLSDYRPGAIFDLREGRFRMSAPFHSDIVSPSDAPVIAFLARMDYVNMWRLRIPAPQRREITDRILDYYSRHITRLSPLRSLEILRSVASAN